MNLFGKYVCEELVFLDLAYSAEFEASIEVMTLATGFFPLP